MTRWQKIGAIISVSWLMGLPIWLGVHTGNWKAVAHALVAGNSDMVALWTMMLGPVVLIWSIGVITLDAVPWIRRRLSERGPSH